MRNACGYTRRCCSGSSNVFLLYLRADCALSPEDALSSLLKGRSVYDGGLATNTAPYKSSAVSLPDDVSKSPFLDELLPPTEQGILVGFHRQMLQPIIELQADDPRRALRELHGVPNCYHDLVFSADRKKVCRHCREVCPKMSGALCSKVSERVTVFLRAEERR